MLSPEAAEWARSLVRRGIKLVALLRAYRLGHAWLWDRWSQALHDRIPDPEELVAAQQDSSTFMFQHIGLISSVLVAEYGTERERMMRSAEQRRAATVRTILAGGPSGRGGRNPTPGLRAAPPSPGAARPRARDPGGRRCAGRRRAARGGVGRRAHRCLAGGAYAPPEAAALADYVPPEEILVAVGRPGHGLDGFRRSHAEALEAVCVAARAGGAAAAVTRCRHASVTDRHQLRSLLLEQRDRSLTWLTLVVTVNVTRGSS